MSATDERAWWDQIATHPAELARNIYDHTHGSAEDCLREILPALTPLPADARILDLGCGVGRLVCVMARALPEFRFVGVDISTAILAVARRHAHPINVSYRAGDGRTIPANPECFDAAFSMLMFQHIPADACAGYVREVARVLRPGCRFRFQDVLGSDDGFLSHQTSEAEMAGWCEDAGLQVVESEQSRLHWEWRWMTAKKP